MLVLIIVTAVVLIAIMLVAIISIARDWNDTEKFPPPTSFDLGTWDEEIKK